MIKIKPKFVYDEKNKKKGVIITIKEFESITELLEDLEDYRLLKRRKITLKDTIPFEEVKRMLLRKK